ncbi:MAG: hypothetical protein ACMXX8_03205 [Candidatus Woesearchaeota archaeon]
MITKIKRILVNSEKIKNFAVKLGVQSSHHRKILSIYEEKDKIKRYYENWFKFIEKNKNIKYIKYERIKNANRYKKNNRRI